MVLINGVKYACSTCIKGHRSSTCNHQDRKLIEIKRKGRPITQCNHCRELRKTQNLHIKCNCKRLEEDLSRNKIPVNALLNPCQCTTGGKCICYNPVEKNQDSFPMNGPISYITCCNVANHCNKTNGHSATNSLSPMSVETFLSCDRPVISQETENSHPTNDERSMFEINEKSSGNLGKNICYNVCEDINNTFNNFPRSYPCATASKNCCSTLSKESIYSYDSVNNCEDCGTNIYGIDGVVTSATTSQPLTSCCNTINHETSDDEISMEREEREERDITSVEALLNPCKCTTGSECICCRPAEYFLTTPYEAVGCLTGCRCGPGCKCFECKKHFST